MSVFAEARAQLSGAVFDTLGEDATWDGAPVRVRVTSEDDDDAFGDTRAVLTRTFLDVRASEVPAPARGNLVIVNPGAGEARYRVNAQPRRTKTGVWRCPAEVVSA